MNHKKLWLLRLIPTQTLGKCLFSLAIFVGLFWFFTMVEALRTGGSTPSFFFALIIAYILPIFGHITQRSNEALAELRPLLALNDNEYQSARERLNSARNFELVLQLGGGALAGLIHISVVFGAEYASLAESFSSPSNLMSALGTILVWSLMTTVIYMLIQQGTVFARLGAQNAILNMATCRQMVPFGRVAISASLAILGALAMYPLIGLQVGVNPLEIVPGAIATLIPMIVIFLLPVWPIHRRMKALKHRHLDSVHQQMQTSLGTQDYFDLDESAQARFLQLSSYRSEVDSMPTWPFDVGNVARLAFYLIIPPLTWVAAALIENVVDALL